MFLQDCDYINKARLEVGSVCLSIHRGGERLRPLRPTEIETKSKRRLTRSVYPAVRSEEGRARGAGDQVTSCEGSRAVRLAGHTGQAGQGRGAEGAEGAEGGRQQLYGGAWTRHSVTS